MMTEAAMLISHCAGDDIKETAAASTPNIGISAIKYPTVTIKRHATPERTKFFLFKRPYMILPAAKPAKPLMIKVGSAKIACPDIISATECPTAPTAAPHSGPISADARYIIQSPKCTYPPVGVGICGNIVSTQAKAASIDALIKLRVSTIP